MRLRYLIAATAVTLAAPALAEISYGGFLTVPGAASDLSGLAGPNGSRLSFGSDLFYDKANDEYYGITDRGPGGGLIDYAPRVNVFKLDVNSTTGAVSNFQQQRTIIFKGPDGQPLSGLNPGLLPGGNAATLGKSFDSEGFVRRANGNFLVSDEYGPSIYEFKADGSYVRAFTTPGNIVPRTSSGAVDYVAGRPDIVTGRQDNRGFEGLTLSRDGKTAYAILQDPLVNEGAQNDGRRSRNVRIVSFDVATGQSNGQFIYRLENTDAINDRIPGTANDFTATNQGRSIGVSAIYALKDGKFLVIERDNRGIGVDDPNGTINTIGSKRIYLIDLNGATDVSGISLAGSNGLPTGVTAVTKTLFLDVNAALKAAGVTVAEKIEGLTIGRDIDGGVSLLLATDNDFSVTQSGAGVQFDICTTGQGTGTSSQVAFGGVCPVGQSLLPSYVYSFAVTGADAAALAVPEPATWMLMIGGFGLTGAAMRRRKPVVAC
ncbi:esterase-like activity of phytase family protein [Glacieibacterium sp.]|uniref:esterase-like activity of phytase family protein n=1 Tax=Glacieibacterium sp. TaxID=2860237 RepID=UPI003AFFA304